MEGIKNILLRWLGVTAQLENIQSQFAASAVQHDTLAKTVAALSQQLDALKAQLATQVTELDEEQGVGYPGHCLSCQLKVPDLSKCAPAKECPRCGAALHRTR